MGRKSRSVRLRLTSRRKQQPWRTNRAFTVHWDTDGKKITTRDGKEIGKRQRELEAEATAYVVSNYFGVQSPSEFYLAAYDVTPAMLLEAVETIAQTVKAILEGCQPQDMEIVPAYIPTPASVELPVAA